MTWRSLGAVLALGVLVATACGEGFVEVRTNGSPPEASRSRGNRLVPGPFRLVDLEDIYLNGIENDDRPPITFLLVGGDASTPSISESALLQTYVEAMRKDGWRLDPYSIDEDWWVFYGGRGSESVRVGPASRFTELASADEGYSRPKFRKIVTQLDEPLVVVSIDPQD